MTKNLNSKNESSNPMDLLMDNWIHNIKSQNKGEAPDFNDENKVIDHSKSLLNTIMTTFNSVDFPDIDTKTMKPMLKIWHKILKNNAKNGYSTKETTMVLFSLKETVSQHIQTLKKNNKIDQVDHFKKMADLIDILSFLTFEVYSNEKERVIQQQDRQIKYLQNLRKDFGLGDWATKSSKMVSIFRAIGLILDNTITVLIQGESGTGKDLIATTIHQYSSRKNKPFVIINCASIPSELLESELFGHERGAFTGADQLKIGKFELAQGGTVFLDEIGEMSLELQSKLLRVLQNKEIERVGGQSTIPIDVRVIAATNRELMAQVKEKKFRLDLYYRLNVYPLTIPPLRERKEDIIPLAEFFIAKYTKSYNLPVPLISSDGASYLLNNKWNGNIRELENVIQRSIILAQGEPLTATVFESEPGLTDSQATLLMPPRMQQEPNHIKPLEWVEKESIVEALRYTNFNIQQTAKLLKISRTTLYNKMKKYKIDDR